MTSPGPQQQNQTAPLTIGPHRAPNCLVLAPMAGVTDRPFRQLCKRLGAGLAVSEMVSSNSLLWGSEKTRRRADHTGETEPKIVQIVGADPEQLAAAAQFNVASGARIIDINMGCPAKKICNTYAGSALLRDEALVERILDTVVRAVDVPVILKIRTGWDRGHRNGPHIARIAERCGIQALSVHGRTRADAFTGEAEYDTIRTIRAAVSIPVIANGDIRTPQQARDVLAFTGAAGIMIGRAAQGRPWIFREIDHFLRTGEELAFPPFEVVRDLLLDHLENVYGFYGAARGVRVARKHIGWYTKGFRNSASFRARVNQVESARQQFEMTRDFFVSLDDGEAMAA